MLKDNRLKYILLRVYKANITLYIYDIERKTNYFEILIVNKINNYHHNKNSEDFKSSEFFEFRNL